MLHEFCCNVCGFRAFHQGHELAFLFVRHDGVELSVDEAGLIDGKLLPEILWMEKLLGCGGLVVAGEGILVGAIKLLHSVQSPDASDLHWLAFDLLLLKKRRTGW